LLYNDLLAIPSVWYAFVARLCLDKLSIWNASAVLAAEGKKKETKRINNF
jgi:hypothetical protein